MRPSEKKIKNMLNELSDKTSPEFDKKIYEMLDLSCSNAEKTQAFYMRRKIMRGLITKLATAAVFILAVGSLFNYVINPMTSAHAAWGDILDAISRVNSVVYNEKYILEKDESTNKVYINEKGVKRIETQSGGIIIFDFNETSQGILLLPDAKKAYVQKHVRKGVGEKKYYKFSWLDWIAKMHERECKFVGEEIINGAKTYLYVNEIPFETTKVWIDPQTNLPVRMEEYWLPNTEKKIKIPRMSLFLKDFGGDANTGVTRSISSGRGSGLGIQEKETEIRTDFVWNSNLNESSFCIPEGYDVEERVMDNTEKTKEDLIEALAFYVEMNENIFPLDIDILSDPNVMQSLLVKKYHKDGPPKEEYEQAVKMMGTILEGVYFVQFQKANDNWGYAGSSVKFGDANTPLYWWKPQDSNDYEVIYGDLSIGKLSKERLPK